MNEKKQLKRIADSLEGMGRPGVSRDSSYERRIGKEKRPWLYRLRVALQTSAAKSLRATEDQCSFPIMGFVGPNGGGKTAAAVKCAQYAMSQGRKVLSTVPLLDPKTGELHELYVPWTDWDQLIGWEDGDVLADEIISIAGSRESQSLDVRAQVLLVQLRKLNVRFWWTAPSWKRADTIIREVTQAVTECRGHYANKAGAQERRGVIQSWAPKRLFSFRTYESTEFDDWTSGKREKADPLISEWFHGVGSDVFKGYDTLGAVNVIRGMDDGGVCDTCAGTVSRRRRRCVCKAPAIADDRELVAA